MSTDLLSQILRQPFLPRVFALKQAYSKAAIHFSVKQRIKNTTSNVTMKSMTKTANRHGNVWIE
jgi:phosphopantetheinyl transferase (holo-ACP synthase)